jgi:hypothetical protein
MVVLKNISRDGNLISCDYYPEAEECIGHICIDISTQEIVEHKPSNFEGRLLFKDKSYAWHARNKLIEISNEIPLPTQAKVLWY